MQLYFLRHGIAEERSPSMSDAERKLVPEGIAEIQRLAQGLKRIGMTVDRAYTSPLPRCAETAEIVAEAIGLAPHDLIVHPGLAPGGLDPGVVSEIVKHENRKAKILFVGHEPDLSMTVGSLIGGAAIDMKKGGLARVDADRAEPGRCVLRWLLTPDHLS
jgi:phosphohistidine phosphatase